MNTQDKKGEQKMIRVDYYDKGSCRVKYFKTNKDVESFRRYLESDPWRFTLCLINFKRV